MFKRVSVLWQADRRKVLMSLSALAVASTVVLGSGANFTSSSANPGNTYTAGDLKHTNSKDAAVIFEADKMKPGESRNGTVDITNNGDIDGVFTLSKTVDSQTAAFASKLRLKVEDCGSPTTGTCTGAPVKYDGVVSSMAPVSLGTFVATEAHRYKFTVSFPDGGTAGADNPYKGATADVTYNWESVNN